MKHIGMDVHSTTTHITVLNNRGRKIRAGNVRTQKEDLEGFFLGIPGPKRAALEESQMADFVARIVQPLVQEVIRCQPQHNRLISESEHKYDEQDSYSLAELLYLNKLKSVHHPEWVYRQLREAVRSYWASSRDLTRIKNRLKAFYLFNGIHCTGERVYSAKHCDQYLASLDRASGNLELARLHYERLDLSRQWKARQLRMLRKMSQPFRPPLRCLATIPGIGGIGAYTILAYLEDGWRIPNKRKLWQYCGLGMRRHESRDIGHRGASRQGNRYLKNVFMTAAASVAGRCTADNALTRRYHAAVAANVPPDRVRRNLARKVAVLAQHGLRFQEDYDDERINIPE
ncbi:MAG: transposase [Candidatus Latescibacterota bacterium]